MNTSKDVNYQEVANDLAELFDTQPLEIVVQETEDYVIKRTTEGKFKKEMKYKAYMSHMPETEEEEIELYKILNSNEENSNVIELKAMIGKEIEIERVYTNPYQSFDEETGVNTNGVSTILKDKDIYYATSSKSVYFSLNNFFKTFGYPNTGKYKSVVFKVTGTKQQNGVQINLSLVRIIR